MADNNKNINPEGLPPDSDLLLTYLKREMSNVEKHELEKRMLADDFMADAAEGLSAVNNPAVLTALTADVNAKFGPGSGPAQGKAHRSPLAVVGNTLAVAASVALLIVAGYFISLSVGNNRASEMAMADKKIVQQEEVQAPGVTESEAATDTAIAPVFEAEGEATEDRIPNKQSYEQAVMKYRTPNVAVVEEEAEEAPLAADYKTQEALTQPVESRNDAFTGTVTNSATGNASTANWDLSMYGPASNNNNNYSYTPVSAAKGKKNKVGKNDVKTDTIADQWGNRTAVAKDEDVPGYYVNGTLIRTEKEVGDNKVAEDNTVIATTKKDEVAKPPVTQSTSNKPENKSLTKGLERYTRGDYKGAIADLETALKKEPNNYKAQYSLAMAYKNTNKPDMAIARFNSIPPASPYYENALWEKANLYLQKDKDDLAVATLKAIVKLNGTYKVQAQNMLKKLQEQNPQLK